MGRQLFRSNSSSCSRESSHRKILPRRPVRNADFRKIGHVG
ncbi:hypothetical protein GTCCBUS3UF5_30740 [Geobacillus thermoleovorans CCB_US3_UF5]|uniref:Uncharacterized protein n=2 Tax=Geobacillus thermoleovorans group TaxID=1505648 RepID=U2X0X3_GEOKU|nr:hypothetical protein GTCCBUS3UF5_30740 [Geobacillus thermoleovorans CCB_US3_UF5]GAD11957.1 hypothetical protein GBL_0174 [Geobacillus kaustophilus GBlys]GAJ57873.1 hypothetical protein B23_1079 [Geobacillus thermoleovorans B23]